MFCGIRARAREEAGQAIIFLAIGMVVMIAMAGFAVDVGHTYLVQRQLQAAADASALAGALELPNTTDAVLKANQYGAGPGGRNQATSTDNATMTVTPKCVTSIPGCEDGVDSNAITVTARSEVPTLFAKVLGFDSFTVDAKATACSPCMVKRVDVMLVLDRTGSMCTPDCTNFNRARDGMRTFLKLMDPRYVKVGLAVLPPAVSVATRCAIPGDFTPNYNSPTAAYTIVPLSSDYASSMGTLNGSSNLVSTINCIHSSGRTGYANAIDAAQTALNDPVYGRAGVQKVIVMLSDGAANYGPTYYPVTSPYRYQPCHQGVASADTAKTNRTAIYSIGYALPISAGGYEQCRWNKPGADMTLESPNMDAFQALQAIASSPTETFYNVPDDTLLTTVFSSIAADVVRTAQLIDNGTT